jgi:transcriptional regulator with XRE-family HTH domain
MSYAPVKLPTVTFAERLYELRFQQGYTLRELGSLCDLTGAALCEYEHGRASPTLASLERIADAFGISVSELLVSVRVRPLDE